jgi:glycosyltransferase involved in cell wall biosynthesis
MRVLWVSHIVPYPPVAGVTLRAYNLLKRVAAEHDVHLASFVQTEWLRISFDDIEYGLQQTRAHLESFVRSIDFLSIPSESQLAGRARLVLRSLAGPCYTVGWLSSPAAHRVFARLSKSYDFDVVHFDTISLAQYAPLFSNVPSTLGHHNVESHMLLRRAQNERHRLKSWYFRREGRRLQRYEQEVATMFAAHIACSDVDVQRLRGLAPNANVTCVPNGVDIDFFRPLNNGTESHSLVFVGTMNWYPNVDAMQFFARHIWPALRDRWPELQMNVVGTSPPRALLKLGRRDQRFKLWGFLEDIRSLVSDAILYVCPVRDGGGTKLKLLDAFAMGKCVVAHPLACEGLNITPDKDVVLAESAADFIEKIGDLLRDPRERERIGSNARTLVERKYSFDAVGEQMVAVLESVANRR